MAVKHARLVELVEYAERQRATLLEAVAMVPEQLRDTRPADEIWSVAEVLEHLVRVEGGIAKLLAAVIGRARSGGLGPEQETGSVLGDLDIFRMVHRERRLKAPEMVAPQAKYTASEAIPALEQTRQSLRDALAMGDGLALGEVFYPHQILGSLTAYQWVLFVAQHEARHAAQIEEVGRMFAQAGRQAGGRAGGPAGG